MSAFFQLRFHCECKNALLVKKRTELARLDGEIASKQYFLSELTKNHTDILKSKEEEIVRLTELVEKLLKKLQI